ncbi:MAG: hypothetical protein JSR54_10810 [Proteobacteria bacterium]|nr:hypothetical protein [Pseudomonadota bacterium]
MRALPALGLTALLALTGAAAAPPGAPLTEPEVHAFMHGLAVAAQARDASRIAAALAPDCRIELRTLIAGQERVTLMTRDEYVGMLGGGYAGFKELKAYDYHVDSEQVALEDGAATVVSRITETVDFDGQHVVTHSEETARVERRADGLRVVAVSALTTGS